MRRFSDVNLDLFFSKLLNFFPFDNDNRIFCEEDEIDFEIDLDFIVVFLFNFIRVLKEGKDENKNFNSLILFLKQLFDLLERGDFWFFLDLENFSFFEEH
jgi:hypothetical protein